MKAKYMPSMAVDLGVIFFFFRIGFKVILNFRHNFASGFLSVFVLFFWKTKVTFETTIGDE